MSFPAAQNHYVDVEATIPAVAGDMELFLPVWTPGSYMVREYSRQIESIEFLDIEGKPLKFEKTRKNRWLVHGVTGTVTARYRCYCHEMSVRNCWVEKDFALLTGAQIFMAPVGKLQESFRVQVELPPDWKRIETGLSPLNQNTFAAQNYDELIDCPLVVGNPAVYDFKVAGVAHRLVNEGEAGIWDGPRSARDAQKIVETAYKMWGNMPYAQYSPHSYTFFNLLTQAGGGLEHKNSTVLMSSRWGQATRKQYLNWLSLVAHEFFHAWNVKTLRPKALGPFDYENEVYTPSLWVAEGFTAYYDDLLVRRAGFSTHKEYLEKISNDIDNLQKTPGRLLQPLRDSSYDAWIKLYRPDENTINSGVSYYLKGGLVGLLLDARIRQATQGHRSLDDVMRRAYQLYSGPQGYTEEQFRNVASEVAGISLKSFFADAVDSSKELDYQPMLAYYGLRFKKPGTGQDRKDPEVGWWGGGIAFKNNRFQVVALTRGTPLYDSGLNIDDEVIAIDDFRIQPDKAERLDERLQQYKPGTTVSVLVARREKLQRFPLRLIRKPQENWTLEIDPDAKEQARQHREAWLGPDLSS